MRIITSSSQLLSPGQTDRQVVTSGHKLNLHRDLRWVAKRTSKFPREYTQVAKEKTFKVEYHSTCADMG